MVEPQESHPRTPKRRRVPRRASGLLLGASLALAVAACSDDGSTITGPASEGFLPSPIAPVVAATSHSYTTNADFAEGTLVNVNYDTPNQLQLNTSSGTFPFIWIALSQRCTIAKVNTDTGAILGEYRTLSDDTACSESSRTTVGLDGSVWVGHRGSGYITRVGLAELNQCVDRNNNGTIETSSGYGDVLAWPGAGAPVSAAADECILASVNTGGADSRHMSVDANNDLWVGDRIGGSVFRKYSGSGTLLAGPFGFGCGGYGGLIDAAGVIWSATSGGSVLRWDPASGYPGNAQCIPINNYGIAVGPDGNVWVSTLGEGVVRKLSPAGAVLGAFFQGTANAQGLAVDGNGHVWISSSLFGGTTVSHLLPDGTFVGLVPGTGVGSTGISVDANGNVWSANRESHNATRIDPDAGPIGGGGVPLGAVDLTVSFPATTGRPLPFPYNYSDMTGAQLFSSTSPQGSWTVVQDGGDLGSEWRTVTWNTEAQGSVPPGTQVKVEARAADTEAGLGAQSYVVLSNGVDFSLTGRFIQVRATLIADADGNGPVLSDLAIEGGDDVPPELGVSVSPGILWTPNHEYHPIQVTVTASDNRGAVTVVGSVVSSEADDAPGGGDGNTTGDIRVVHNHPAPGASTELSSNGQPVVSFHPGDGLQLRAERRGGGGGRTYTITLIATDGSGNTTTQTVTVSVPHDQGG